MLIVVIFLLALLVTSLRPRESFSAEGDYLSHDCTRTVEGFFVILVFLRHFQQYLNLTNAIDIPFKTVDSYLGQLIVVPFLFFTGYGMMISITKKGIEYVKSIPMKFIKLLLHYDLGIFVFFLYNVISGNKYDFSRYLLSLIAWRAVGNSNWYIFCILSFYIIVYITFSFFKGHYKANVSFTTIFMCVFVLLLRHVGKDGFWYNTALVLPFGMIFSLLKEKIDSFISNKTWLYVCTLCLAIIAFVFSYQHKNRFWVYLIMSCIFATIMILILMKYKMSNPFLHFLGGHVFSIYMLQRIPDMILIKAGITKPINLCLSSFALTILVALAFEFVVLHIDNILFPKPAR